MIKWCLIPLLFLIFESHAQTCCSGGVPLSSNIGFPAAGKGSLQTSLTHDLNVLRTLKNGQEKLDDKSRIRRTHSILLSSGYTFSPRISMDISLSYVWQQRIIQQPGLSKNTENTNGFGDIMLLLKYQLTKPENSDLALLVGVGGKLPTGKTAIESVDGIPLNLDLQPGSGALDGIFWGLFTKKLGFRPSASFNALFVARVTGIHDTYRQIQTYEIGNNFRFHLGLSDQLVVGTKLLNASLNLRYRQAFKDKIDGQYLENTGGKWVFLNPEVRIPLSTSLTLSLQIEIPIYANITGEQLSTTYRTSNGLYYTKPTNTLTFE